MNSLEMKSCWVNTFRFIVQNIWVAYKVISCFVLGLIDGKERSMWEEIDMIPNVSEWKT
jgi:hypothetical protein